MNGINEAERVIYFDNAATSWPKPEVTYAAMAHYAREIGANPGRSGHRRSIDAGRVMLAAREAVCSLIGTQDPLRIVFTKNATEALNIAVLGFLTPGDHVITSSMEHNSLMRPLRALEKCGVGLTCVPCAATGEIDPQDVRRAVRPNTVAVYLTHASNVTGTIMPVGEIGRICRECDLTFCVDAAQTAGCVPLDVKAMYIDLLAFTGHKSLFGPQGTGGLYLGQGLETRLRPLSMGGTGSRSEHEEQPEFLPDKFEAGTPNTIGLAGLQAGIEFILSQGVARIREHEERLTASLVEGLAAIPGIHIYGVKDAARQTAVVSFNLQGQSPADIALALDEESGILARPGLQCAPAAHRTIGSFPHGTLRFSLGYFSTVEEVEVAREALARIASRKGATL